MGDPGPSKPRLPSLVNSVLYVMLGPIVWALNFLISYSAHVALCAPGIFAKPPRDTAIAWWIVVAATVVSVLILGAAIFVISARRQRAAKMAELTSRKLDEPKQNSELTRLCDGEFEEAAGSIDSSDAEQIAATDVPLLHSLSALLAILSAIGVTWMGITAFIVGPCLQLR